MEKQLTGSHRTTYEAIFQHPVSRNLKWVDVKSLLVSLADTVQENADVLKVTRHGKTLTLHRPRRAGMEDVGELMKMRSFLTHSDSEQPTAAAPKGAHVLVVIDHRLARVYRGQDHGTPAERIVPDDADNDGRHLHNVDDDSNGQRKPEPKSFYEAVAKAIGGAEQILLFGSGTGASSAMEHLQAELRHRHAGLAARVIDAVVVDERHSTDDQLLAQAREAFAAHAAGRKTR